MAIHFKLTCLGRITVAVGVFIRVGGPSVSTVNEGEYPPNPIVFLALTLNLTFVLGSKIWLSGGTRVKAVFISLLIDSESVSSVQAPVPESQSN